MELATYTKATFWMTLPMFLIVLVVIGAAMFKS